MQLIKIVVSSLVLALLTTACYYDSEEELYQYIQPEDCTATMATFSVDVEPILIAHCNRCHRNDRQDGNVNLEGYQNVKPYADDGFLYGTTNHDPGYAVMPTSGVKIPFCDIEKLRLWIADGAPNN